MSACTVAASTVPTTLPVRMVVLLTGATISRRSVPCSRSSRIPPALPKVMNKMNHTVNPMELCVVPSAITVSPRTSEATTWLASAYTGGRGDHLASAVW